VVRHAATHSPYYRRRLAETGALGNGPVQLRRLPVLNKSLLMEHFDELVCDPRLRRDQLLDWAGPRPSLPRQRLALLGGAAPSHISRQGTATTAIGLHRVLPAGAAS
jgi:hypothetical protein